MALGDLVAGGTVRVLSRRELRRAVHQEGGRASSARPRSTGRLLVLVSGDELNALKSFRNLAGTRALAIGDAEVQDYVWAKSLLFTEAAVSFLESGVSEGGEA